MSYFWKAVLLCSSRPCAYIYTGFFVVSANLLINFCILCSSIYICSLFWTVQWPLCKEDCSRNTSCQHPCRRNRTCHRPNNCLRPIEPGCGSGSYDWDSCSYEIHLHPTWAKGTPEKVPWNWQGHCNSYVRWGKPIFVGEVAVVQTYFVISLS